MTIKVISPAKGTGRSDNQGVCIMFMDGVPESARTPAKK
jgi:hypothetical protein